MNITPFSFNHYRVIGTSNWTVPDLIKYLVSLQSARQPVEIERFRQIPAFPKEGTADQQENRGVTPKFRAADLYEPLDVFRKLDLPIIDWRRNDGKHRWKSSSKEGKLGTA